MKKTNYLTIFSDSVNSISYRLWCAISLITVISNYKLPELEVLYNVSIGLQILCAVIIIVRSIMIMRKDSSKINNRANSIVSNLLALPFTAILSGLITGVMTGFSTTALSFIVLGLLIGIASLLSDLLPEPNNKSLE